MKIIAFVEACQGHVIRKILKHCGLRHDPPPEPPPRGPLPLVPVSRGRQVRCDIPQADAGITYEVDPEYLEHARRHDWDQILEVGLPWGD